MTSSKLSVKPNKTEYLLFNPSNINPPVNTINLDSNIISPSDSAKNLGVIFQTDMSLDKHFSSIVKSCFLQLRHFRRIRPFISKTAAVTLAIAFVHFRLDFVIASSTDFLSIQFTAYKQCKIQMFALLVIFLVFLT